MYWVQFLVGETASVYWPVFHWNRVWYCSLRHPFAGGEVKQPQAFDDLDGLQALNYEVIAQLVGWFGTLTTLATDRRL